MAGVAGLAATLVCALFGSELLGQNPVPVTVFSLFWIGGQLLSAVLGDVWRLVDPYDHIAGVLADSPVGTAAVRTRGGSRRSC